MDANNNAKSEFEGMLSPEREAEALEIARMAREILPIAENKCACPRAARKAQTALDSLIGFISDAPEFITYPPHLNEDLERIDHYIKETDRLCGLDGILEELFDTGNKVRLIIDRDSTLYARTLEETSKHVKSYLRNHVSQGFDRILEECGEEKEYRTFPVVFTHAQEEAFSKLGIPQEWVSLDPTYDLTSMVEHHDPIGKSGIVSQSRDGFTVTTGTKVYVISPEGTIRDI